MFSWERMAQKKKHFVSCNLPSSYFYINEAFTGEYCGNITSKKNTVARK